MDGSKRGKVEEAGGARTGFAMAAYGDKEEVSSQMVCDEGQSCQSGGRIEEMRSKGAQSDDQSVQESNRQCEAAKRKHSKCDALHTWGWTHTARNHPNAGGR